MTRVAILDSTTPIHMANALVRAFELRGHDVWWNAPARAWNAPVRARDDSTVDAIEMAVAVRKAIEFVPDITIVLSPLSMADSDVELLKRYGVVLAWTGLDPIFFQKYASKVERYDAILHDGGVQILEDYEDLFGKATGITFPAWADPELLRPVWASGEDRADLIVISDLFQNHRRKDYAAIANLDLDVHVYGKTGSDYRGIGRGRLDSVSEVMGTVANYPMSLILPPCARDVDLHQQKYPVEISSRTVEYMAMGIPSLTIISGSKHLSEYPELLVAQSVEEAGQIVRDFSSEDLALISRAVRTHFEQNFSGVARVCLIEALIKDESWRSLSSLERARWFQQFNPIDSPENTPVSKTQLWTTSPTLGLSDGTDLPEFSSASGTERYVVLSPDASWWSRGHVLASQLEQRGHEVTKISPTLVSSALSDANVFRADMMELDFDSLLADIESPATIICTDCDVVVRISVREKLNARGMTLVGVNDSRGWSEQKARAIFSSFNLVATGNRLNFERFRARGFSDFHFLPLSSHPEFIRTVASMDGTGRVIRVQGNPSHEMQVAPVLESDVSADSFDETYTCDELETMGSQALATALVSDLAVMSFSGQPYSPVVSPMAPYVAEASDILFFTRPRTNVEACPYNERGILVSDVGELTSKANLLATSDPYRQEMQWRRDFSYRAQKKLLDESLEAISNVQPSDLRNTVWTRDQKWVISSHLVEEENADYFVSIDMTEALGTVANWQVRLMVDSSYMASTIATDEVVGLFVGVSAGQRVAVELTYMDEAPVVARNVTGIRVHLRRIQVHGTRPTKLLVRLEHRPQDSDFLTAVQDKQALRQ